MAAASSARTTPGERSVRPLRLLLMVIGGVLTLLCLGGVGVGINLYDEATAIDRGEPDVTVDNYLREFLVQRNDVRAESLECKEDRGLEPIRAFRADVDHREEGFGITIDVSWGPLAVTEAGSDRTVATQLTRTIAGAERSTQDWQFRVVDEGDGWKVCGAQLLG
ncbi:hypothetical protein Ais01nite_31680 [Asanoa ishikariensis]|nr:hypothetical protein [Asanoa ishikariensis]GIF65133.1 hypothetical protein Ais01nite_31680 [Asanoa ishikariensis]